MKTFVQLLAAATLVACGSRTSVSDAGVADTGASVPDAAPADAGLPNPPCIQGGPDYDTPPAATPLPATPAYLGSKELDLHGNKAWKIISPLVVSGSHMALLNERNVLIYDLQGNYTGAYDAREFPRLEAYERFVADKDGFYFGALNGFYALSETGAFRWAVNVRPNINEQLYHFTLGFGNSMLLDPESHVLYGAATDGYLYAIDTETGKKRWEQGYATKPSALVFETVSGAGNQLTVSVGNANPTQIDVATGATLGQFRVGSDTVKPAIYSTHGDILASVDTPRRQYLLDKCGRVRVDYLTADQSGFYALHFATGNTLVKSVDPKSGPPRHLRLEDMSGVVQRDIVTDALPFVVGADGTIFTFLRSGSTYRFIAYGSELQELWSFDVPVWPGDLPPLLLDDGRLLWLDGAASVEGRIVIHTIQTKSPGLAHTGYPLTGHDNQRTGWAHSWR